MKSQSFADRRCDGILRREFLHVGGLGVLGLGLTDLLRLRASAAQGSTNRRSPACILIWLDGGPSHLETFDPKPDAPAEVRGPFGTIPTVVPGLHVAEYLPRTAAIADRLAVIRSMTSPLGEHNLGSHYLLTGYQPTPVLQYPSYGAVLERVRQADSALPGHIAVANPNPMARAGYLGGVAEPFVIDGDPAKPDFKLRDMTPYPGVTEARLERRRGFAAAFDAFSRQVETADATPSDPAFAQAYRLITSPKTRAAFDLSGENPQLRNRYGRHTLGQSCLLARRLIEAGAHFVTVTDRGWDTHNDLFNRLKEGFTGGTVGKVPKLDTAFATLIEDLTERGMLDSTLVLLMGEFGRTPKLNPAGGRDHWPRCFSVVLAGGGVSGGQVIGASDSFGESPADRPVTPADLARTVYKLLGVDPDHQFTTADGRPVQVNRDGSLIPELLA